jgi:surface carbohydrate biosynthesis protein (TIGR04326 family)
MINEKILILGFRRYSPETRIIGFQHGALFPGLLCSFVSEQEAKIAPLPDKVICSGQLFCDALKREGFPADRLVIGPALRYKYLWEAEKYSGTPLFSGDVLVVLPLMDSDAAELLSKVLEALGQDTALKVLIKPHPMASLERLLKGCFPQGLPCHFQCVEGDMGDCLSGAKVVIAMSSSSIIEVVSAGKPVVVVGRETAIDLNPLGLLKGFDRVLVLPEDIRKATLDSLSARDGAVPGRASGRDIVGGIFHPVTDQAMQVFLAP